GDDLLGGGRHRLDDALARRPDEQTTGALQGRALEGIRQLRPDSLCRVDPRHARVVSSPTVSIARYWAGALDVGRVRVLPVDHRILPAPHGAREYRNVALPARIFPPKGNRGDLDLLLLPDHGSWVVSAAGVRGRDRLHVGAGLRASRTAPAPGNSGAEAERSMPMR